MRGVLFHALLHNRAALFARRGVALDGREYSAHLPAFFQELPQSGRAFPVESFQSFALMIVHTCVNLPQTYVRAPTHVTRWLALLMVSEFSPRLYWLRLATVYVEML